MNIRHIFQTFFMPSNNVFSFGSFRISYFLLVFKYFFHFYRSFLSLLFIYDLLFLITYFFYYIFLFVTSNFMYDFCIFPQ